MNDTQGQHAAAQNIDVAAGTMARWLRGRRGFLGSLATAAGAAALLVGGAGKAWASDTCDKNFICDQNHKCNLPFQCNNFSEFCDAQGFFRAPQKEEEED